MGEDILLVVTCAADHFFVMEAHLQQAFANLDQASKDYLTSDEHKAGCKEVYEKSNGPLNREQVAKLRESFTAFVVPKTPEEVRSQFTPMTQEQKDAAWAKISEGNETIDLAAFTKLTTGLYTHALSKGVQLENLKKYSAEWRATL